MAKSKFFGKLVIAVVVALIGLVGVFYAKPGVIINNIIDPKGSMTDKDVGASEKDDSKEKPDSTVEDSVVSSVIAPKPENIVESEPVMNDTLPNESALSEPESNQSESSEPVFEAGMIAFTLKGVSLSGQTLKFEFIVNNNDVDRRLTLTSARIIDSDGVAFSTSEISLAKTSAYQFDLPKDVPVQMEVLFERLNKDIEGVSFLEIKGSVYGQRRQKIEITMRNLNVD